MAMVDAYTIGITLNVKGNSLKQFNDLSIKLKEVTTLVDKLTESFELFNKSLESTNATLGLLNKNMYQFSQHAVRGLRAVNTEMKSLNASMATGSHLGHPGRMLGREIGGDAGGAIGGYAAGRAGMGGLGLMGLGYGAFKGFEAYGEYQRQLALFSAQGFGPQFTSQAASAAMASNIPGVSQADYLRAYGEATTITKDPTQAGMIAGNLAKMSFANRVLFSREGRAFTDVDQMNLLRSAELETSSNKAPVVNHMLDLIQKGYAMEGGNIRSSDLVAFTKRIHHLSDGGFMAMIPIIQALGGMTAGSSLRTFESQLLRGQLFHTGKSATARLTQYGVLGPKGVAQAGLLSSDPIAWINQVLLKAYASHGINTPDQLNKEFYRDFAGTIPALLNQIVLSGSKIEASRKSAGGAFGIQGSVNAALGLPQGQIEMVSKNLTNLAKTFGEFAAPAVMGGIKVLDKIIKGWTLIFEGLNKFTASTTLSDAAQKVGNTLGKARTGLSDLVWDSLHVNSANPIKTTPSGAGNTGKGEAGMFFNGRLFGKYVSHEMNRQANHPTSGMSFTDTRISYVNPLNNVYGGTV